MGVLPEIFSAPHLAAGLKADLAAEIDPAEFKKFGKRTRKQRRRLSRKKSPKGSAAPPKN